MPLSDSDSSSCSSDYKNFRELTRERLLNEMMGSTKIAGSNSTWKVLIIDILTIKIVSSACKMADITQEQVSSVEYIHKKREPMPSVDAIYFIQPTKENVLFFLSDMSGRLPLYKKAFVFFSSPIPKELLSNIKRDSSILPRIAALREMNLEYFTIDSQGFVTDHQRALEELFVDDEDYPVGDACLNVMATRIATVLASLREFPHVRYRAPKTVDKTTVTTFRDLIPTNLAARVWDRLSEYKQKAEHFPKTETCELLILDRPIDQIAPVIHEWTYDAMCHDLLNMEGNKYIHEVPSKTNDRPEKKEVLLEEHDSVWLELRHAHIADASEKLHEMMTSFISKNKAAQIQHGSRNGDLSTRDLLKTVQALPQYSEQIDKLSLHVEIAGKINRLIREMGLREVGQLEQDLVFGDAGTKEVTEFLNSKKDITRENKLRLLMIFAAIYPEKFDSGKRGLDLMQLAELPEDDMNAVHNMRLLGLPPVATKKHSAGAFSVMLDIRKKKRAARKDRPAEQGTWQLSRFYPLIEELIEKLGQGQLSKAEYPSMNDPETAFPGTPPTAPLCQTTAPQPMRSRRTPTWARPRSSDGGYSSDSVLRHAGSDLKKMGQRIFVFIVGGATRSELRVCHKLTSKLQREVVLGSTSLDDPPHFITKLKLLTAPELLLGELQIQQKRANSWT